MGDSRKSGSVRENVELPVAVTRGPILSYGEPRSDVRSDLRGSVAKLETCTEDSAECVVVLDFSLM